MNKVIVVKPGGGEALFPEPEPSKKPGAVQPLLIEKFVRGRSYWARDISRSVRKARLSK